MLSNAYFLAKFRFDTAENEPAKNLQNFAKNYAKFANFANPNPLTGPVRPNISRANPRRPVRLRAVGRGRHGEAARPAEGLVDLAEKNAFA